LSGDSHADLALVVGTSKGPIEEWLGHSSPAARATDWGLAGVASGVAREMGLGPGPRSTICTACASGLHALGHAAMLLAERRVRRAIVVAVESSLHPLFLGSFERLGVLAREGRGCRPFDENRDGFLMSEAAAAVCLEAPEAVDPSPDSLARWPRLERFALGADAAHLTGGDRGGITLRRLLARVMDGRHVDLVHAHGTGTPINDPMELQAIEASLVLGDVGDARPNVYSHKGALGHSLGASGLVSVVLNCEAHRRGVVPPNVQTTTPLPAERVRIERTRIERPVRRSIAIAAGFGGAMAAVTLMGGATPIRAFARRTSN